MVSRFMQCAAALAALVLHAAEAPAGHTDDPVRATVQVRYGQSAGSGTAIAPTLVLSCAHIYQGEPAGRPLLIAKHFSDSTDHHRGYLLSQHTELDLALIAVPDADLEHALLVEADPPTPQAATFFGHAGGRREILAIGGYISRGYTTHFDIVSGHDSIEGQSGGGVFDGGGRLLGVMHGRPNRTATARGGGIFTPMRHIRHWMAAECRGPRCQPFVPPHLYGGPPAVGGALQRYGKLAPPPPRQLPPEPPVADSGELQPSLAAMASRLEELALRIERLDLETGPRGPPGERGPAGPPGEPGPPGATAAFDMAAAARELEARLMPTIEQRIEEAVARRVPHYFSIVPRQVKGN